MIASNLDKSLKSAISIFKDNENKKCLIKSLEKYKNDIDKLCVNQNMVFDSVIFEIDKVIKSIETLYENIKKSLPLVNKNVNKWTKSYEWLSKEEKVISLIEVAIKETINNDKEVNLYPTKTPTIS